jgi:hypothetical protein
VSSWVDDYLRASGAEYPPLSGDDLPGDYDGAEWKPGPAFNKSACESNADALMAATGGLGSAGAAAISPRAALAWELLEKSYEWLRAVRDQAVAVAQREVREGIIPRRPLGLKRAQAAEERAFLRFCKLAKIDRPAGWPIGMLNTKETKERNDT